MTICLSCGPAIWCFPSAPRVTQNLKFRAPSSDWQIAFRHDKSCTQFFLTCTTAWAELDAVLAVPASAMSPPAPMPVMGDISPKSVNTPPPSAREGGGGVPQPILRRLLGSAPLLMPRGIMPRGIVLKLLLLCRRKKGDRG